MNPDTKLNRSLIFAVMIALGISLIGDCGRGRLAQEQLEFNAMLLYTLDQVDDNAKAREELIAQDLSLLFDEQAKVEKWRQSNIKLGITPLPYLEVE